MSSNQYPESYKLFDELGAPQPTGTLGKSSEYPTSYSIFDQLAQPEQKQPEAKQIADQIDQIPQLLEEPQMEKSSFWERLGRAGAYQAQTSNAITPEGTGMIARQAPGGILEGLTLGAVDVIPPKNKEEEFVREIFRIYGIGGPISLANKALAPLVRLARSSPIAPRTLAALTRLTGVAATGAGIKTVEELFKSGELPTKEELLKEGAIWAGIDAIMQGIGLGAQFGKSVSNIARKEGVPRKEVFSKLWDATKGFLKKKFTSPRDLKIGDVEVLADEAIKVEAEGFPKVTKPTVKTKTEIESTGLEKPVPSEGEQVLTKPENISIGSEGGKGRATVPVKKIGEGGKEYFEHASVKVTKEEQQLIDASNSWEKAGDLKESSALAQQAREMIFKRLKAEKAAPAEFEAEDKQLFENIKHVAADKTEDPLMRAQAQWIVDEMAQSGNDVSKLQSIAESMPTQWKIEDGKFVPSKAKAKIPARAEEPLTKKSTRPASPKLAPRQPIAGKKQAAKRSDIIETFRKAFNDPIRLKKFKQRAAGIHKLWPKVTRLLKANDVETAAHEIGHNLHTTLYGGDAKTPSQQRANINKALAPFLDELKPLAHYEPYGMEGFAEFTRLYVTNPDVAREMAPKFYQKFENDLDAQYPELKNALLEARDYYDQYLHGTPQSRIRAQTDYASDSSKLENLVEWVKKVGNLDNLKTQLLDDVFPAKRLVAEALGVPLSEVENLKDPRNLYRSLRVLKGAVGKGDVFLLHETFDAKTLEKTGDGLRAILKKLPNEEAYREFNDYLIARRSIEKTAQKVETGINLGDAVQVEKDLRDKYGKLAEELDKYNDSLLKYARDGGLLSEKQYQAIKKNNLLYVPFQRTREAPKGGVAGAAGKLQAGKPIKRMKGSTRNIIAPIESIIKNTYSIIVNAEKNLSGQVLAELAKSKNVGMFVEQVPTPMGLKAKVTRAETERATIKHLKETGQFDLLEQTEDGAFVLREDLQDILPDLILKFGPTNFAPGEAFATVYFDGRPTFFELSPELFQMWTKGTAPYTADLLTKILRVPARTLRAGAILNPKFIQKNFIRDTWGGFLFTKYGKSIKDPAGLFIDTIYSPLSMLAQAAGKGKIYVEWMKSGGSMSTMQSLDRQSVVKKLEEVRRGLKPTQVIQWLRKIAEISEEGNRLAEFARALEVEGNTRLGKEIAAFASRDLSIDFAKIGMQTKALNQIIPFWNATIAGGEKLFRTLGSGEDRAEFLARVVGFIVLPSLMLAWLNKDDERVKEFQEQEKDFNFITFIGDTALKIPVPFETGVIAHGLTQRMFNYFMNKDPEAFEGFMGSIKDAMLPAFIPVLATPFMEAKANRNYFTGGRIIPAGKEALIAKYQYKNNSSTTARLLGRAMSYMLGQETRSKAASPAIIDHFINAWGGGLGRLMVSISDASLEAAGLGDKIPKPTQPITEKFGLDAFITRFPRANTRSIEKFYDYYQDATARQKSLKYAEKMDLETEEAQEAAYQRFDKLYDYRSIQRAYKAMQKSQREINNIWNDPSIDPVMKKTLIDNLYLQEIEFCKEANEDIRAYIEEAKRKPK